jgi:hypothetical protein
MTKKGTGKRTRTKASRVYAGVGIAAALVAAVFLVRYFRAGGSTEAVGNYYRGEANAAVVLEEFSDFR